MNHITLLNKPKGMSSNQALQKVKRAFGAKKAGHTGTLDPMATGMLPICFGRATKLIEFMLDADKAYTATIQLGQATDTGDAEGEVIAEQAVPDLKHTDIEQALSGFRGDIEQVPPMYSALKQDGKRLYQLARQGKEVARPARPVTIYALRYEGFDSDTQQLTVFVRCSKGTYIRVLGEEIAKALGTLGHLVALHRNYCAGFESLAMHGLDAINETHMLPADAGLAHWPIWHIDAQQVLALQHGKPIVIEKADGWGRLYCDDQLVAVAEFAQGALVQRKFC